MSDTGKANKEVEEATRNASKKNTAPFLCPGRTSPTARGGRSNATYERIDDSDAEDTCLFTLAPVK